MNSFKQFVVKFNDWLAYAAFAFLFILTAIVSYFSGAGAAFITLTAGGVLLLSMFGFWFCISGIYEMQREQLSTLQKIKSLLEEAKKRKSHSTDPPKRSTFLQRNTFL